MNPVETAAGFAAEIRRRAPQIEQDRRIPGDLAHRMAGAGLFRLLVPELYGGLQVEPLAFFETLNETARADGAVGWCQMIGVTTGMMAASLPAGSVATLSYGERICNLVQVIAATAMGQVLFPHVSRLVAEKQWGSLGRVVTRRMIGPGTVWPRGRPRRSWLACRARRLSAVHRGERSSSRQEAESGSRAVCQPAVCRVTGRRPVSGPSMAGWLAADRDAR